jgi:hypothetical protein
MMDKQLAEEFKRILIEGGRMFEQGNEPTPADELAGRVAEENMETVFASLMDHVDMLVDRAIETDYRDGDSPFSAEVVKNYLLGRKHFDILWGLMCKSHMEGEGPLPGAMTVIRAAVETMIAEDAKMGSLSEDALSVIDKNIDGLLAGRIDIDDLVEEFLRGREEAGDTEVGGTVATIAERFDTVISCYAGSLVIVFSHMSAEYAKVLLSASKNMGLLFRSLAGLGGGEGFGDEEEHGNDHGKG